MTIRAHRLVVAGSLAVAALTAPVAIALTSGAGQALAGPPCLAHIGNIEDGVCAGYSNGNGINVGSPGIGLYGPESGSMRGGGIGVSTGPLLPGQSWTVPIG